MITRNFCLEKPLTKIGAFLFLIFLPIMIFFHFFDSPADSKSQDKETEDTRLLVTKSHRRKTSETPAFSAEKNLISDVKSVVDGHPVVDHLPESALSRIAFYRVLHKYLHEDLRRRGNYETIFRIFQELHAEFGSDAVLNSNFATFLADSKTDIGVNHDFSSKISMFRSLGNNTTPREFRKFLSLLGERKEKGELEAQSLYTLSKAEVQCLTLAMANAGDNAAIATVVNYSQMDDPDLLKEVIVKLMKTKPAEAMYHFNETEDPRLREFCMHVAIEEIRRIGAHDDVIYWEKELAMPKR